MRYILLVVFSIFTCIAIRANTPAYVNAELSGMPATQAMADSVKKGFRGLSVVNDKIIWISGQRGLVGRTTNGGRSFSWRRIKGHEKVDFRTLHAFDRKNAMVATTGSPGIILRTNNGGKTWKEVYYNHDTLMFFDGAGFWDKKHGLIFGDPLQGRMFLAETCDGGYTWKEITFENRPQLVEGEAAFAASGTTIRTLPNGHVYIATGGVKSRLWHSRDYGHHWEVFETPIIQGKPSQGVFSLAMQDTLHGVIVGGDYTKPDDTTNNCFITIDGGKSWFPPEKTISGYRSCVEYVGEGMYYATGISGTDYSHDHGRNWNQLMQVKGYNVIANAADKPIVHLAGGSEFLTTYIEYSVRTRRKSKVIVDY